MSYPTRLTKNVLRLTRSRGRSITLANRKLGDIVGFVENRLKGKRTIRILEVGCGYGLVLMQLKKRFGDRVDLTGINLRPKHGTVEIMKAYALRKRILTKAAMRNLDLPKIVFYNVDRGLPFKANTFDAVLTQSSVQYFKKKFSFLEEVNRVLTPTGSALIDLCEYTMRDRFDPAWAHLIELWRKGKPYPLRRYLARFKTIKPHRTATGKVFYTLKKGNLAFDARLVTSINLERDIWNGMHWATKTIYVVP